MSLSAGSRDICDIKASENPYTITLITQTEPNRLFRTNVFFAPFSLNDPSDVSLIIINPPTWPQNRLRGKKELP